MAQSSVWCDDMDDVTLDEVRIMLDEEKLRQIALRKDLRHLIRIEAINRIQNERILKELALSGDEEISIKAVNNISNQEFLADIALSDVHPVIKYDALRNIEDDDYFDEISQIVDDDFIQESIEDIDFERKFGRKVCTGLS